MQILELFDQMAITLMIPKHIEGRFEEMGLEQVLRNEMMQVWFLEMAEIIIE